MASPARRRREPRIGTAGWSIPRAHVDAFPRDGTHLERYAGTLDAAEINSSFYRSHSAATYARWAASVPAAFRFAVKLPRELTHDQRLRRPARVLDRFLAEAAGLGRKLGVVLVQTPPSLSLEARVARGFFTALRDRYGGAVAFEPRHASWFTTAAESLLQRFDIARVAADPAPHAGAGMPAGSRRLAYWRLHGAPRMYWSDYSRAQLAALTDALRAAQRTHKQVWCIFDNTASGSALGNAVSLRRLLRA